MPSAARIAAPALMAILALATCQRDPAPPGPTSPDTGSAAAAAREAIEAINRATAEAVARGDAAAIAAHYSADALMLPAGADFVSGPAAIGGYFQRAMDAGMKGLTLEVVSVDAAGDLAVETGRYEATGAGGHHLDHGKYVVTWRREAGQWKVYRDISTTSRPPAVVTPEATPLPAQGPPAGAGDAPATS
jgi:uncharacterized protein (TIGR02246 family)